MTTLPLVLLVALARPGRHLLRKHDRAARAVPPPVGQRALLPGTWRLPADARQV